MWDFPAPPKGAYTIRVEAIDHDGNIGFAEAKIYVDQEPPASETGDEPTTSAGSDGSESGGSESGGGGGSEGGSEGGGSSGVDADSADTTPAEGDSGCGCRDAAPTPAPGWLLVVGGALLVRRRRRV